VALLHCRGPAGVSRDTSGGPCCGGKTELPTKLLIPRYHCRLCPPAEVGLGRTRTPAFLEVAAFEAALHFVAAGRTAPVLPEQARMAQTHAVAAGVARPADGT